MADFYVRPDASHGGTNAGTSHANAWQGWASISWGSISAGDTLYMSGAFTISGSNMLNGKAGASGNPITIRGDYSGGEACVITCATANCFVVQYGYTAIKNIDFRSSLYYCLALQGVALTQVTVDGCTFTGTGTAEINYPLLNLNTAATTQSYVDVVITNNTFTGAQRSGVQWFPTGGGTYVNPVTRFTISNNTFINFEANNNGACISLRLDQSCPDTCKITDLVIEDNTFTNIIGLAIQATGKGATASPTFIDGYSGVRINRNTITNQKYNILPASGRPYSDGWQTGGGITVTSFGTSSTVGFGPNEIAYNTMDGLQGLTGGINFFTGTYWVHHNTIRNVETRSDRVDGNGILADFGDHDSIIEHNYVENCLGSTLINSGMAYGAYAQSTLTIRYNSSLNTKHGVMLIGSATDGTGETYVYNNTFRECVCAGVYVNASNHTNLCTLNNNSFTGTGSSYGTIGAADTSGGYSIFVTDGEAFSSESNNGFYGYPFNSWNANTGAAYALSGTDVLADPLHNAAGQPQDASPLIAAGVHIRYASQFWNPPTIGAYEYQRARAARTLPA